MPRKGRRGKSFNGDLEEFRILVQVLVPTRDEQVRWICDEIERLTYEHPELKEKLEKWCSPSVALGSCGSGV